MTDESLGTSSPQEELKIINVLLDHLVRVPPDARDRILRTAITFFEAEINTPAGYRTQIERIAAATQQPRGFSRHGTEPSPKDFMLEKSPTTDVERVACLAYYLTHYRDTPHFKTADISLLNTEAAQRKFSNPSQAMNNSLRAGLIVAAGKGMKQLSADGEQYVDFLPDHAAARESVKSKSRARKKKKKSKRRAKGGTSTE